MSGMTYYVTLGNHYRALTKEADPMASQRRQNVLVFPNSKMNSQTTKLNGVTFRMLRADSSRLPLVAQKAAQLHALRPGAASLLEKLVDDLIAEVS